jgi:plastocyanin
MAVPYAVRLGLLERSQMIRLCKPAAALAVLASAFALAATAGAATPKLVGVSGKNNSFKLTLTRNGKKVKTLKKGTYKFVIHDDSKFHNYALLEPGGKKKVFTTVKFVGTKTFTLKLKPGKYDAYCVPHKSIMFQRFTVK